MGGYKREVLTGPGPGAKPPSSKPTERYGLGLKPPVWPIRADVLNRNSAPSAAEQLVWDIGTGEDRGFRAGVLGALPKKLALPAAHAYRVTYETNGLGAANLELLDFGEDLSGPALELAQSDSVVTELAEQHAGACSWVIVFQLNALRF